MLRPAFVFLFLALQLSSLSQTDSARYKPVQTKFKFDWGNNTTSIMLTQYGPFTKLVMIHLHDDEFSSDRAAQTMLAQKGGLLIELENKGKRLMSFKKSGRRFYFDPNRIFTVRGLEKNLKLLNGDYTSAALSSVKSFAAFILQNIPSSANQVIALHNNENGKYSIKSYTPYGTRAKDAADVHINPLRDADNFFILTDTTLFGALKARDFNVVLQNRNNPRDDGSLSIYFGKMNLVYVNVEAQKGRYRTQVNMLRALLRILN